MVAQRNKKAVKDAAAAVKRGFVQRRDGAGHADPKFAADLLDRVRRERKGREDEKAVKALPGSSKDSLATLMGEQFVKTATSGEDESQDLRDETFAQDAGGPFVETSGQSQFAAGVDESNPKDAEREARPRT